LSCCDDRIIICHAANAPLAATAQCSRMSSSGTTERWEAGGGRLPQWEISLLIPHSAFDTDSAVVSSSLTSHIRLTRHPRHLLLHLSICISPVCFCSPVGRHRHVRAMSLSHLPLSASLASSSAIVCSDKLKPGRLLFIHECIPLDKQIIGKSIRTLGRSAAHCTHQSHTCTLRRRHSLTTSLSPAAATVLSITEAVTAWPRWRWETAG
jgi:hypothetical protein